MGRILAIDYGKKRTGIAVSDPTQTIAQGLTTVETHKLMTFLDDYMKRETVDCVVVGKPKRLNGVPSENAERADVFCETFRKAHPGMRLERYDERFTSTIANKAILESGIGRMARRNKALVDQVSATIILQSYMESLRFVVGPDAHL